MSLRFYPANSQVNKNALISLGFSKNVTEFGCFSCHSLPVAFLLALVCSLKHNRSMINMLQKNWLTAAEAATIIGCRVQHVRLLARSNQVQASRIGDKLWVIEKGSAEKYAKEKKNTGRPRSGEN